MGFRLPQVNLNTSDVKRRLLEEDVAALVLLLVTALPDFVEESTGRSDSEL